MSSTGRSSESYKYAIQGKRAKDALNKDEQELFELCCLAGVEMSPAVFRIIMNLLKMNVSPIAIVQMLKSMVNPNAPVAVTSLTSANSSATSDIGGSGSSLAGHSAVKQSASASSVSGKSSRGSSMATSLKGSSKSGTSIRTDSSSSRPRSTRGTYGNISKT